MRKRSLFWKSAFYLAVATIFFFSTREATDIQRMGLSPANWMHVLEFAVLAFLIYKAFGQFEARRLLPWLIFGIGMSVGITDEALQSTTATRHPDFWDLVRDLLGLAVGYFILSRYVIDAGDR